MKKITLLLLLTFTFFITSSQARQASATMYLGLGATVTGSASAMVPDSTTPSLYGETSYDSSMSGGLDQVSLHVGFFTEYFSDAIELSHSFVKLTSSAGSEGVLSLDEVNFINRMDDASIGFLTQNLVILVPYYNLGFGLASWADSKSATSEEMSQSVARFGLGLLFHVGPNTWLDLSYNFRSIGAINTNVSEIVPLQTTNAVIKIFF